MAVVTAGSSGMALATAKLFVEEGAYVVISGRDQDKLDKAVKEIGRNATGVQADSSKLADLDRLIETVKKEEGHIDVLFASAGHGGPSPLGSITEEQFDEFFGLNTRGTLFTVQKALPLFNDGAAIIMNGSIASIKGFPGLTIYGASKAALRSFARTWAAELKDPYSTHQLPLKVERRPTKAQTALSVPRRVSDRETKNWGFKELVEKVGRTTCPRFRRASK